MEPSRQPLVARILIAGGLLQLAVVGALFLRSDQLERDQVRRLRSTATRHPGAVEIAAESRLEAAGIGMIGRIEVPRLGLSAAIVEGIGAGALLEGVGHVKRTAFPGEPDNVGLAGHRDTHFWKLENIAPGDLIRMHTPDGVFWYRVDSTFVVRRMRGDLLDATGKPMLTLVTSYPFYRAGLAPRRLVVRASLIQPPARETGRTAFAVR